MLSSVTAINLHETKKTGRIPFLSLVCHRDCRINYKVLVKDLRANKNAILCEFSVSSAAGSVFFQEIVEIFMRFREGPRAPTEP